MTPLRELDNPNASFGGERGRLLRAAPGTKGDQFVAHQGTVWHSHEPTSYRIGNGGRGDGVYLLTDCGKIAGFHSTGPDFKVTDPVVVEQLRGLPENAPFAFIPD